MGPDFVLLCACGENVRSFQPEAALGLAWCGRCPVCERQWTVEGPQRTGLTAAQIAAKNKLEVDGNTVAHFCDDCLAPVAGCDYGDPERCGRPAYKWIEAPGNRRPDTLYFCEQHGKLPEWLEAHGFGQWGAYQPGKEGCSCDFPF